MIECDRTESTTGYLASGRRFAIHAVELSFYFEDPEGHVIEIYWATGLQPIPDLYAEPIDLEVPEEQLRREVDRLAAHFGVQPSA